ncbi:DUF362 domain-containing protein [Candidatus Poribacteria bacterium]|nr:DUF362 domain-containing protein [Candidatus Poribacteria bacterium]
MNSKVFYSSMKVQSASDSLIKRIDRLFAETAAHVLQKNDITAVKLHFGERGNTAFIRPVYVRRIIENINKLTCKPFITDANTVYSGSRGNAIDHYETAIMNGFCYPIINAPLIIADGLRGDNYERLPVKGKHFKEALIAKEICQADTIISLAHFKAHEMSGFGGSIKNIGMGCASKGGKLAMHSNVCPQIKKDKCTGCGKCMRWCSQKAIIVSNNKAIIDEKKCIGCGECITTCIYKAIILIWNETVHNFQEKIIEYVQAIVEQKQKKIAYFNFIMQVSPECDCYAGNDAPLVPDLGILASLDPIAIDQCSVDLVNNAIGLRDSKLPLNYKDGDDKFKAIYPAIDWSIQLDYGNKLGLGTRKYELVKI